MNSSHSPTSAASFCVSIGQRPADCAEASGCTPLAPLRQDSFAKLFHLSSILWINAEEDMFSTRHLRMAIVFVYKGDLYREVTADFLKVVTAEVSKHCCFMI